MASRRTGSRPKIALAPTISLAGGRITAKRCQGVKRDGTQCRKPAYKTSDFCKNTHGGNGVDRIGPANAAWKGGIATLKGRPGRWTEMLAAPLRDAYIKALRDPEILSLEHEIALVDVRLEELVKRTGAHSAWSEVQDVYNGIVAALAAKDNPAFGTWINRLRDLAEGNVDNDRAWHSVMVLTDRRRTLVESERRRLVEANMFMTRAEAHAYGSALMEIVTRHVRDRDTLLAIVTDFKTVIDAGRTQTPVTIDM